MTLLCACLGAYVGYLDSCISRIAATMRSPYRGDWRVWRPAFPRSRSIGVPILCGLLAVFAGLVTEYRFAPFVADSSLSYFLTHLTGLKQFSLTLIGLGGLIGFWVPFRRRIRAAA
jgi:hypothetical protein